jgi:signal transduction histidine kinase
MSKIVLEDRIYIKLKRNIKDIKIKLILLARILYVIIIVEDDNSNNIFVEADRDMLTQLISNNLQSNAIRFTNK